MSKIDLYPNTKSPPSAALPATGTAFTGNKVAQDVNVLNGISGSFTQSGLRTNFKVTTMNLIDTALPFPATPLTARNAMSVINLDPAETFYVGGPTVTADNSIGTVAGWPVGPGESFNLDITDAIVLYGIAPAGKTILIKIMELA